MGLELARRQSYAVNWKGNDLGLKQTGSPSIKINGSYVPLNDVDEFFGTVAEDLVGWDVQIAITFKEISYPELYARLLNGQVNRVVDGSKLALDFDTVPANMNRDVAGLLVMHPIANPDSDLSEDIAVWKAAPEIQMDLMGDRTKYQSITVNFKAYPEPLRPRTGYSMSAAYLRLGDYTALDTPPNTIGLVPGGFQGGQALGIPAITLDPAGNTKISAFGFWGSNDAVTITLNGAIIATDTAIVYKSKSVSGQDLVGRVVKIGSEYVLVTADTNTGTTGTITAVRAWGYSVAASHADNTVSNVQKDVRNFDITASVGADATGFASSDATKATVSNKVSAGTAGVITNKATGSANITATVGAVTSKVLAVTAN